MTYPPYDHGANYRGPAGQPQKPAQPKTPRCPEHILQAAYEQREKLDMSTPTAAANNKAMYDLLTEILEAEG